MNMFRNNNVDYVLIPKPQNCGKGFIKLQINVTAQLKGYIK